MTPTQRLLDALAAHGFEPRQNGSGWSARCPSHDDRRASLSVSEGEDGRALVCCHAGCATKAVVAELGLTMGDLMPSSPSTDSRFPPGSNGKRRRRRSNSSHTQTYDTASECIDVLSASRGNPSAQWTYLDDAGKPVGVVVRWDGPDGKSILPVSRNVDDRWRNAAMTEPRPLYGREAVGTARRVYVVEGEKCVDAARSIGLVAVTSASGSSAARKADWSPLAGREVVILPDSDSSGEKYASDVAAILTDLGCTVRIVRLPGLDAGGDLHDWLEQRDAHDPDELRQTIERLADAAPVVEPERPEPEPQWQPFPTDDLPEPLPRFVRQAARAIGCDECMLAVPLLSALAGAIGNARRVELKEGWDEPAIIWSAVVARSGDRKSPPMELVLRPLHAKQRTSMKEYREAKRAYERDRLLHEKDMAKWKRSKESMKPIPVAPEEPVPVRFVTSDVTTEGMAALLSEQLRGLLLARDELAAWFGSFDRYSGKAGGDAAAWAEMHGGRPITVDRKGARHEPIMVERATVSICGTIQPRTLSRCLTERYRELGLSARFLFAFPPSRQRKWSETGVSSRLLNDLADVFDRLLGLDMVPDDHGDLAPRLLGLDPEAKTLFIEFVNRHGREQAELDDDDLRRAWPKLEGYVARIALVVACCRGLEVVDAEAMRAGIRLIEWFKNETRRIYATFGESDEDRERRRLAEWIERRGGVVTVREVQQRHRQYRTARDAEAALQELVEAGYGTWQVVSTSTKQRRVFKLSTASTSTDLPETAEIRESVDVDSVDDTRMQSGSVRTRMDL